MSADRQQVHFGHCFHPAGHGTFFSGRIQRGGINSDSFVWVYDCGSKRPSHLMGLVEELQLHLSQRESLDLVCISHFDADHVCGLEVLMRTFRVRRLVMPYLSLEMRLRQACQLSEEVDRYAHLAAAFTLAPGQFLQRRGFGDRFQELVLIKGGQERPPAVSGSNERIGPQEGVDLADGVLKLTPADNSLPNDLGRSLDGVDASITGHDRIWRVDDLYEFCFYNRDLPDGKAPQSGQDLDEIASEVIGIATRYGLFKDGVAKPGWVAELRALYRRHFGNLSRQRNDISLCILARPTCDGPFGSCQIFRRSIRYVRFASGSSVDSRQGLLLTGDLTVRKASLRALKKHFGAKRWFGLDCMQIPHHGSRNSWQPGNTELCSHTASVICAPGSGQFPSSEVLLDLIDRSPKLVDYENGLCFDYHTEADPDGAEAVNRPFDQEVEVRPLILDKPRKVRRRKKD